MTKVKKEQISLRDGIGTNGILGLTFWGNDFMKNNYIYEEQLYCVRQEHVVVIILMIV